MLAWYRTASAAHRQEGHHYVEVTANITAQAVPWNPASPEEFTSFIGDKLIEARNDTAIVRSLDGSEQTVALGWLAVRVSGSKDDEIIFVAPPAGRLLFGYSDS
jgi:hypothetical protein